MHRHIATGLVLILAGIFGCTSGSSPTTTSATQAAYPLLRSPARTNHTISVSSTTDPGTPTAPSITTYVSEGGGDTITWSSTAGALTNFAGLAQSPYPQIQCNSSPANNCASGAFTPGTYTHMQPFNYTFKVGTTGPTICGRIIIVKP